MAAAGATDVSSRFSEVLKVELQRQDRSSWHTAVMSGVHFASPTAEGEAASVSTVDLAHAGIDDRVMVCTMEALLRVVPLVYGPSGVTEWSISARGNPNITNESANAIALFLSAVRGAARVDLFGTSISGRGQNIINDASQRLTVRPRIIFAQGNSNASGSEAAAGAAVASSGAASSSNAARPGARAMTVSSASSVDIAALRQRRDQLLREEGLQSMDQVHQQLRRAQSAASSSSRKSGPGGASSSTVTPDVSPARSAIAAQPAPVAPAAAAVAEVKKPAAPTAAAATAAAAPSQPVSAPLPAARAAPPLASTLSHQHDTTATSTQQQQQPRPLSASTVAATEGSPTLKPPSSTAGSPTNGLRGRRDTTTAGAPARVGQTNPNMVSNTGVFGTRTALLRSADSPLHNTSLAGSPHGANNLSIVGGATTGGAQTPPGVARSASAASGGSDDTTATEMPDRQDDLDVFMNIPPGSEETALNLCQAYPHMPHANILDPVTLRYITVLNVAQNSLTELHSLPATLLRLDASGNQITSMVGCFTECRLLLTLNLRRNQLTAIEGLETNLNLGHLFVGRNFITRVSGIGHLVGLETLDISYNQIRTDAALRALSQNGRLMNLITYGNPITAKRNPGVMRSLMRNLVPTLIALDNEPVPGQLRATAAANLSLSPKPPTKSTFDDRSSFLGVTDHQVNLPRSAKKLPRGGSSLHADPNVTNSNNSALFKSLALHEQSLAIGDVSSSLTVHQRSVVAGYSAPDRMHSRAVAIGQATAQHHQQQTRYPPHHLSRAELIASVEARNASLMLAHNAARIARELQSTSGRPPPAGHVSGTTHHTSGTSDTVSNTGTIDQGPLATGRGSAASPRSNIPLSRSMSGMEWAHSTTHHPNDPTASAMMLRHVANGNNNNNNKPSPPRDVEGSFVVQHRGSASPNRPTVKMSPHLTSYEANDPYGHNTHQPQQHSTPHYYASAAARSGSAFVTTAPSSSRLPPSAMPGSSPNIRGSAAAAAAPLDVSAVHHQSDVFSPPRGESSLFAAAQMSSPYNAERDAADSAVATSPREPAVPRVYISDLIDYANDPEDVTQWLELADQDDRTIHTALNALLFVLEADRHATTQAFPRGALSAESERCLSVIERRQLTEDMDVPSSVADRIGLSEQDLNADATSAVVYRNLDGRRGKLLEVLQRMTMGKTDLRYLLAYARAKRYDVLFECVDRIRRRRY